MSDDQNVDNKKDLDALVQKYLKTGSKDAKDDILRIGRAMAKYYAGIYSSGETDPGLKNAAKKGFKEALKKFDPKREVQFSSYATNCIISEIRGELNERRLFKVPRWLQQLQDDVIKATEELSRDCDTLPTLDDVSARLNIAEKGIAEIMQAGVVPMESLDLQTLKSIKHEAFKLPIEDVITIRKSLDRLQEIQKRVLLLIQDNLSELNKAIKDEEQALSSEQARYLRLVESKGVTDHVEEYAKSYKIAFPQTYDQEEVSRYFEVLSDECGLRLINIKFHNGLKQGANSIKKLCISLEVEFEGRYRGLIKLLDHLRNKEEFITISRVNTTRSKNIPARIAIDIAARSFFKDESTSFGLTE